MRVLSFVAIVVLVVGCGQKGALYRPADDGAAARSESGESGDGADTD